MNLSRRGFLKGLLAGSAVTAAGVIVPQSAKLIFDLGANSRIYNPPWELIAIQQFDFADSLGYAFERTVNGERQRGVFRQKAWEHEFIHGRLPSSIHDIHPADLKAMLTVLNDSEDGKSVYVPHKHRSVGTYTDYESLAFPYSITAAQFDPY